MMGANYRKGNQSTQGKRATQIAFSEMVVGVSILGILTTIIGFTLYHLVSSLLHYIKG